MPPGKKIEFLVALLGVEKENYMKYMDSEKNLYPDGHNTRYQIEVCYEDYNGKKYIEKYETRILFDEISIVSGENYLKKIATSLDSISKDIGKI